MQTFQKIIGLIVFPLILFLAVWVLTGTWRAAAGPLAPGDPLPQISCVGGWDAFVMAEGLTGPDSLAFDPSGVLHVSDETAGTVVQVAADGTKTTVVSGLNSPEGIAFDAAGNLYVVEDEDPGRLLKLPGGTGPAVEMATGLRYPEAVVVGMRDKLYFTESDVESLDENSTQSEVEKARSNVTEIDANDPYTATVIYTATPKIDYNIINMTATGDFISLSELIYTPDEQLILFNELGGVHMTRTMKVGGFDVTLVFSSTDSVLIADPIMVDPPTTVISRDPVTPEGGSLDTGPGAYLIAEEDTSGAALSGTGRLSRLNSSGDWVPLCTGFGTLEDVVVGDDGQVYVTEESSGRVIRIVKSCSVCVYLPTIRK